MLEALDDTNLLGAAFPVSASWAAWRALLASLFALPLTEAEAALYRQHTGRAALPKAPAREAWLVIGRRGGKSRISATVAVYLACFRDYGHVLAPGERGTLPIIAADRRQARTVFRYVNGLIDSTPMLAALVESRRPSRWRSRTGSRSRYTPARSGA